MKKVFALVLCGLLLLQGCGKDKNPKEPVPTETVTPTATPTETPTATPTETPTAAPTEEVKEEKIPITLPPQDLLTDYTSAQGLRIPAGSQIAAVVKGKDIGFWKAVRGGMEMAVEDINTMYGYTGKDKIRLTYEAPADDTEIEAQINIIDAVLAENPLALCLSAIDMGSCQPQLETAEENGIPVILLDGNAYGNETNTICSTDHYAVGQEAAIHMSQAVGGEGQVAIVAHQPLSESCVEREKGFRVEMFTNYAGIQVLPEAIYDDGRRDMGEKVRELLNNCPDLKGIFCTNEKTAQIVLAELEKQPERQISVVTVDAGKDILKAIRDGKDVGTVCQNPYGMGYVTVIAAARASLGMPNNSYINPGFQWIDKTNIDAPENQMYLYE